MALMGFAKGSTHPTHCRKSALARRTSSAFLRRAERLRLDLAIFPEKQPEFGIYQIGTFLHRPLDAASVHRIRIFIEHDVIEGRPEYRGVIEIYIVYRCKHRPALAVR